MGRPRPKQKRLGQKLRQIRKELDISQDRMPERLGRPDLHPGRISEYEQNKREPSLLTLLSYAKLAGVHLEDIVNDNVDLPAILALLHEARFDGLLALEIDYLAPAYAEAGEEVAVRESLAWLREHVGRLVKD